MKVCHRVLRKLPVILCFCAVPFTQWHLLAAQMVPPVTGRVVDVVSAKPIAGASLTLQLSTYEGWSVHTEVKSTASSDRSGRFSLSGANHPTKSPIDEIRAYWLTVNQGLDATGQEENSAATQVLYNPMSNRRDWAVGNKRYFPLTITFRHEGCDRVWAATCTYMSSKSDITIPLIPVLDDVNDCERISDSSLRENCRQLNTYRAAFVHADSYDQVQRGKALCAEVDHAVLSSACLQQLALYIAHPAYERPIKPQVNEPTPDGMFPDSVAGLPAMKNGCGPQLEFDGRINCAGGYGTVARQFVAVYFERWPENTIKLKEWSHLDRTAKWSHLDNPAVTEEVRTSGKVLRNQGKWYSGAQGADGKLVQYEHKATSYVWFSANTLVEVLFYDPMPEQEEFLSYYLAKFPSTSQ